MEGDTVDGVDRQESGPGDRGHSGAPGLPVTSPMSSRPSTPQYNLPLESPASPLAVPEACEVRDSPERESSSGCSTPAGGRGSPLGTPLTTLRKKKKRFFSGDKKKLEFPPLLPLIIDGFKEFMEYVTKNNISAADTSKGLAVLIPHSVPEDCPDKNTVLHFASEEGNATVVEALLKLGYDSMAQNNKGYTPLHLAVLHRNNGIVKKLLANNGESANLKSKIGWTPLHVAVAIQNHDAIRHINAQDISDFGIATDEGDTALHLATKMYKKAEMMLSQEALFEDYEDLLEKVDNAENIVVFILDTIRKDALVKSLQLNQQQSSPLHILAERDSFALLRTICKRFDEPQPEFDLMNSEGLTPFLLCVGKLFKGDKIHMDMMSESQMLKEIEEQYKKHHRDKKKPLFRRSVSIPDSPIHCAHLLLEKTSQDTVDLPHPLVNHMTALQIVLQNVDTECSSSKEERDLVALLLNKGADVTMSHRESAGEAPIHLINSQNFDRKLAVLFIEHLTADTVNQQDEQGETVLHVSVSLQDVERMEMLLRKGANVMIKDSNKDRDDIELTKPNMEVGGKICPRTPLMVALKNHACRPYFQAILSVGLGRVVDNVNPADLLEFFQTHISAAAFTKNNQALRALCQYLARGSCVASAKRLMDYSNLTEKEVLYQAVHYLRPEHFEKTFHKTALAWTNENDDPISASDLLHFEYETHDSKREGLQCMKNQLTNDKLLFWMTRTFSKFYPTPTYILCTTATIVSVLQLGSSYFFYLFDIISDLQLTHDYSDAYSNQDEWNKTNHEMWDCAQSSESKQTNNYCFKTADRYPRTTYMVAYYLTLFSMLVSIIVYILGISFFFNSKNMTEKLSWFQHKKGQGSWRRTVLKYALLLGIRLVWPILHVYRRIRYEASRNKSHRRKNLIEFESIWITVKSIEYGIEATVQMIIVLYLLVPFYDQIYDWDFQTMMQKVFNGIAHFLTGGRYHACLLEKVVGKLFINVFAQGTSLTTLRYLKYGMSIFEHLASMIPLFLSYTLQIIARILVLRVFFVTAEDILNIENKGLGIAIFFLIHYLVIFCIKVTFEVHSKDYRSCNRHGFYAIVKFMINLTSSSIVYTWSPISSYGSNPRTSVDEHNTFLPQLLFQLVILVQHLVLILLPISVDLPTTSCLRNDDDYALWATATTVPCLWVLSNMFLVWHYKNFHTWSQTNGPRQTILSDDEPKGISCVTGFCCSKNLFKVTIDSQDFFKVENMKDNTYDFRLQQNGLNGHEMIEISSQPLL